MKGRERTQYRVGAQSKPPLNDVYRFYDFKQTDFKYALHLMNPILP